MGYWTADDNDFYQKDKPEIDRRDEAEREWQQRIELEREWLRRQGELQIVPHEEEKPRTPTPGQIQGILDDLNKPRTPQPKKPVLH